MPLPALHAIVDVEAATAAGWRPEAVSAALLEGGARLLQLRWKGARSGPLLELCDTIVALARTYDARVLVNDRADVARLAGAAGVHVGQTDLSPADARRIVGPSALVGCSTHTLAQVEAALGQPVSYIAVGPVYTTRTKDTGYDAVGLDLVAAAAERCGSVPLVAIGGITLDTAPAVLAAGAQAVAVIGDLLTGGDPRARVEAYLRALHAPGRRVPIGRRRPRTGPV